MQLYAVEAGFARAPGAGGEGFDEVIDLGLAGGAAEKAMQRFLAARRAQCRAMGIVHARENHLPAGMAELDDGLAVESGHGRAEPLPPRDKIIAMNRGGGREGAVLPPP